MARPTALTPELSKVICDAIERGAGYKQAADAACVSERTLYSWLAKGRKLEEPYVEFLHALKSAETRASLKMLGVIHGAAEAGVWQAAAWWLERRYPEEWANNRVEITRLLKELKDVVRQKANGPAQSATATKEADGDDNGPDAVS